MRLGAAPVDGAFSADIPKGDGIITGSVLDDAGDPVARVLVIGQPLRSRRPRKVSKASAGPDERDIDELVREWAGAELWRRRGSVRATTDEDGQYALTRLGDVGYRVAAYNPPDPVKLTIVVKPSLRVRIVPPAGFGRIPALARIIRVRGDRVPTETELLESGSLTAWNDGEGTYTFRDLDPGRYLIGASVSYGAPIGVSKVAEVRSGTVNAALQFPAPDPAAHFLLRPVGPDGETPLTLDWRVHMRSGTGDSTRGVGRALRQEDGVFFLAVPAEHIRPNVRHAVTAQSADWGSVRVDVDPKSTEIVPIVFRKPGYVDAAIAGYAGSGREGRLILQLIPAQESKRRWWSSQTANPDETGSLRLGPVQPGSYELQLMLKTSGHSTLRIFRDVIAVRSGRQKASVTIPALHELTVIWTGQGTPQLSLRPVEKGMRHFSIATTVGADGKAVFRDLPAGEYAVRVPGARRGPPPTVSVPGTTELRLP